MSDLPELTFDDALRIAKGCTDYGGGCRHDKELFEVYQDGIQTVIAALDAAKRTGLKDTQTAALLAIGLYSINAKDKQ